MAGPSSVVQKPEPSQAKTSCPHKAVAITATTNRIELQTGQLGALLLRVTAKCEDCGSNFWFPGLPTGLSYSEPSTNPDGFLVTLPMAQENVPFRPDQSLVGVSIRTADIHKGVKRG